ncbi:MAG: DNA mismatch repair endonuclease MutL [Chlamydiales bacterium]|nr:DNA mismatch repair endonuclease MutL [Chlamydiales bacterium]
MEKTWDYMTSIIRVLSDTTINQIAAGEVIENPASVVKELVENAIDAGSTEICIECIGGGFQLIKVADNGSGMGHDDAILSIERHATSKIKEIDDLEKVFSMGFRGEALSSIASISKLIIHTCKADTTMGTKVTCYGGKIIGVETSPRRNGTTIEVSSLFYNVPARKKFQKSAIAAQMEVTKVIVHLALGFPHISFKLIANNKEVVAVQAKQGVLQTQVINAAEQLLGEEFTKQTLKVEYQGEGIKIVGLTGLPTYAKKNKSAQYLYINNRHILSSLVSNAVLEAYAFAIDTKSFPVFLLHLSIPAHAVDVNVHPQKKQVRFQDELFIHTSIKEAVDQTFGSVVTTSNIDTTTRHHTAPLVEPSVQKHNVPDNWQHRSSWHKPAPFPVGEQQNFVSMQQHISFLLVHDNIGWIHPQELSSFQSDVFALSNETGIVLVDLKELQRTLFYHESYSKIKQKQTMQDIQQLMFPIVFAFDRDKIELFSLYQQWLILLGVKIQLQGLKVLVIGLSDSLSTNTLEEYLEEVIDILALGNDASSFTEQCMHKLCLAFIRYACYRNIKQEQASALVRKFFEKKYTNFSPFKKPIFIHVDENGIDKLFQSHQKSIFSSCEK